MNSNNGLVTWLEEQQEASVMEAKEIPLSDAEGWGLTENAFERFDQRFFRLIGVQISLAMREVKKWMQPLLQETGSNGVVSLVREEVSGKILMTAKQEPGNDTKGCVILAPSFQASSSNLEQKHGGERPPLADIHDMEETTVLHRSEQHQDGGRYFRKRVVVEALSVPNEDYISEFVVDNQRWSTLDEVKEVVQLGLTNPYVRETLLQMLMALEEQ